MFRCPSCATVWKLPLTENHSLLAHKNLNKFTIEREPISLTSYVTEVKDLGNLVDKLAQHDLDLAVKGDNYIECPHCKTCSKFQTWVEAWEKPGEFFDADALCGCGGELWYDNIPGTSRYALICERCDWVKPRAVISGHEGDLT